jgi:phage-related protein
MIEATVDGITFSSLGLGLKKHNIPVLPDTKDYTLEIAGRDGSVDFGTVYGTRSFSLECVLMADDPTIDYQAKVAALAAIFNAKSGDQIFIFEDRPGIRYVGRYSGTMPIEKIIFDGDVSIPIKMNNPFPESIQDTSIKEYGQDYEYGQGHEYVTQTALITSASQAIPIENDGTIEVAPLMRITGAFTNLSLSDGGNNLVITDATTVSDVYEIDCNFNKFTVKKNGLNAYAKANGIFFLLKPGTTNFVSTSTNPNFKIEFIFRHKYLY